jgi:transcriptional regulator with XRE-family HTH domain
METIVKMNTNGGSDVSELATLISTRLQDISNRKSQGEVSDEVGFNSKNVLSIIKRGSTKLSLDRVDAMAKALELDLRTLMLPALRQYFSEDVINALRETFAAEDTKTEREIITIARNYMDTKEPLSYETREQLKVIFESNKPAGK